MKNMKFWRTALVATLVLTVMLSVTGGTIAWFTDSVESGANVIKAGNLDVELYHADNKKVDATTKLFEVPTLWEPGAVAYENLKVVNEGDLHLYFDLGINFSGVNTVEGTENGLDDVLKVAVVEDGVSGNREAILSAAQAAGGKALGSLVKKQALAPDASKTYGVVIYWEPSANDNNWNLNNGKQTSDGEEYLNIDLGVELFATQFDYESDSFGPEYDEDAKVSVYNAADLADALAEGGNVILGGDVTVTDPAKIPAGVKTNINLAGNTLNGSLDVAENAEVTISGGNVANTNDANSAIQTVGNVTLDNVTVESARHAVRVEGGKTVINSGTYKVAPVSQKTLHALNVSNGGEAVIYGGTFVGPKGTAADSGAAVNVQAGSTVKIYGGDFSGGKNNTLSKKETATLIVYGGTFDQDPSMYVAHGYAAKQLSNGKWFVTKAERSDNIVEVTGNQSMDKAIRDGATALVLGDGNFIIPDSAQGKTLSFIGNGNTVVATQDDGSYEGCDYSLDGSTVTFEGITINTDSTTYTGYARMNGTYKNCTINGTYTLYGDSVFENCTFNVSGDVYNIWTWGAPTAKFINCTFNSDGKALLLYGQENTKLTVENCVFNDKGGLSDLKAAIEIGNDYNKSYELIVNNTTVNGYEINDKGINTGTTLWANKNSMGTDKLNVVVDGVDVY